MFRMTLPDAKIKTAKILRLEIQLYVKVEVVIRTRGGSDEAMAAFQPSVDLPDPSGLLSASLSPAAITRL